MALPVPVEPSRRVAVVDDSDAVRLSLRLLLGRRGFQVHTFATAADLLAGLAEAEYDCFVIDFKLEDGDGFEVLAKIRQGGFEAPAIMISGWDSGTLEGRSQKAGFAAFVRKPMLETSLADVLDQVLG
ncbi:MAG: response regulator [Hyphomonas sp.]|uniref:response regulator n=1 Tax=Hyphomonas sp. TaxID=87 RepID=UPI00180B8957|nr:response regulator [Hyphomonas sp.]MBA3070150.1 response regulator [Hyphomonas sp.]MBU4060274.1 response regulator [Alphaproteobacteria bacterium]MBU4162942.1 response regulator [Alphaproteobacteria bacterium]